MKNLEHALKTGLSFGLTSGTITTLGLMVGVYSGTHSRLAVVGAILSIAVADAFSDAMGVHVSEESENRHSAMEVWRATVATFFTKFIVASTFVIPVLMFPLERAVEVSVIWGMFLISGFSFFISDEKGKKLFLAILEHLSVAVVVVILTYYFGKFIDLFFD